MCLSRHRPLRLQAWPSSAWSAVVVANKFELGRRAKTWQLALKRQLFYARVNCITDNEEVAGSIREAMTLTPVELKFLLRLLGTPNYRTAITAIKPNPKTKVAERDRICISLCSQGLVEYSAEVAQFAISPAGRTLLNLDTTSLPVTPSELWTLRSCRQKTITPGQISRKVPVSDRQTMIQALAQRGLIMIKKSQIKEVWLTPQGQQFLRHDYQPQGTTPMFSGNLLNHYVRFLRQSMTVSS
ncbi:MAG: hypothetical protein AAGC54_09175 [Cyanobacteria bacterium P01_F01_bin.4]